MSIALENNRIGQVSGGEFLRRNKSPPFNLSILDPVDRTVEEPCSSSSSIGKNSDEEEENEEEEVESKLKKNPLDSAVDALEQALPTRRGISNFYNGKSKSFASLSNATCSSIQDIAKPENAYTRKRKNLLAYSLLYDKARTPPFRGPGIRTGGRITKRPFPSSRSTLAFTVAMNNSESSNDENGSSPETNWSNSRTPSTSPPSSPLPPAPWRSFSVVDLQHCAVSASSVNPNLPSPLMGKGSKPDEVS